jgi:hypothetical protein
MFSEEELEDLDDFAWRELGPVADEIFAIRGAGGPSPRREREQEKKTAQLFRLEGSRNALFSYWVYLEARSEKNKKPGFASRTNHLKSVALVWAADFTIKFLKEVRNIICSDGTKTRYRKGAAVGVATGLAAWLSQTFGITNPAAIGIAALIIHVVATAGRKAFCEMTEQEALSEITKKFHARSK